MAGISRCAVTVTPAYSFLVDWLLRESHRQLDD
jgi:hypothetical protein